MRQIFLFLFLLLCLLASCTENDLAKNYGGTMEVAVPCGQKIVTVTWKDSEFWYLTRPMRPDEAPETLTFHEEASFGTLEGTVVVQEKACP